MNSKEIIGMKIIDKNAKDVAKIAEISFDTKTYGITKIIASTGNPISKKFYEIDPKNILALGDSLLIDTTVEELTSSIPLNLQKFIIIWPIQQIKPPTQSALKQFFNIGELGDFLST